MRVLQRFWGVLLLPFLLVSMSSVSAQEVCNDEAVAVLVEVLRTQLDEVQTYQDLLAFGIAVGLALRECNPALAGSDTSDAEIADTPGLSRSNPVPIGEWFTFDRGQVRVTSVDVDVELTEWAGFTPDESEQVVAANVEYLCVLDDENETCRGVEIAGGSAYVTIDGRVIDEAPIFASDNMGGEVYSGATISGRLYFSLPVEPLNILRLELPVNAQNRVTVFFSLTEPE